MGTPKYAAHDKLFTAESKEKEDEAVKKMYTNGQTIQDWSGNKAKWWRNWLLHFLGVFAKDENGKPERLFGSFQDITDRKKLKTS